MPRERRAREKAGDEGSGKGSTPEPPVKKSKKESAPTAKRSNKEGTRQKKEVPASPEKKTRIHHESHSCVSGQALAVGQGDVGQLGLGADVMETVRPKVVGGSPGVGDCVQVAAGGMHSACLMKDGTVWTFGCNDEGALGRTVEDDKEGEAGAVNGSEKFVQISAGDSHTAAVTADGKVFIWGTFRDINGPIGLVKPKVIEFFPVEIPFGKAGPIVKVASGNDHLLCLSLAGRVYSVGCGESGQLGRIPETFCSSRENRRGATEFLQPNPVRFHIRANKFCDIWATGFASFAKDAKTKKVYSWGLNNYYQLGQQDMTNKFFPKVASTFDPGLDWKHLAGGDHHTVAVDKAGSVYSVGRGTYGQLGSGEGETAEVQALQPVSGPLVGQKCLQIGASVSVSFAVVEAGILYGWGMGSNNQLGTGSEDDQHVPVAMGGKQLVDRKVLGVSSGGQHTILLATEKEPKTETETSASMDTTTS